MNSGLGIGQAVGQYLIEARLGEGGMAVVYRARHRLLGSTHAIKVLKAGAGDAERLLREGRIQSQIRHRNIVAVTDVVPLGRRLALVVEFVDGPTLAAVLGAGPLTLPQLNHLAIGIMGGVAAVHAAGLVHRDLKPGNVLIELSDDVPCPKVTDFGLVKNDDSLLQTASGVMMGTPAYMAPEQFLDASTVDARADVFSMGAVLYHMATALRPFRSPSALGVIDAIRAGRFMPVRLGRPDLPFALAELIQQALAANPQHRPKSAAEMLARWREITADWEAPQWSIPTLQAVADASIPSQPAAISNTLTAEGGRKRRSNSPLDVGVGWAQPTANERPGSSSMVAPTMSSTAPAASGGTRLQMRWVAFAGAVLVAAAVVWSWRTPAPEEQVRPEKDQPAAMHATSLSQQRCALPKYGGTLKMRSDLRQGPLSLYGANSVESKAMRWVFETLTQTGHQSDEALVSVKMSDDQKTAWITLRAGVRFHPHPQFATESPQADAADLAWSILTRMYRTGNDGGLLGMADWSLQAPDWPKGVELTAPRTVKLTFDHPAVQLASELRLAHLVAYDLRHVEDLLGMEHPAGTGAFRWVPTSSSVVQLARFEHYWRRTADGDVLPYLDGLEVHLPRNVVHQLVELKEGRFDLMRLNGGEAAKVVDTSESGQRRIRSRFADARLQVALQPISLIQVTTLGLWGHLSDPENALATPGIGRSPEESRRVRAALGKTNVRRALSMAIDRDAVARIVGRGALASTSFLPSHWLGAPPVQVTKARAQAARALLEREGVHTLTLHLNNGLGRAVGQQIQRDWKAIGVDVDFSVANVSQAVRTLRADGGLQNHGTGPAWPANPYRHLRNMAMIVRRLKGSDTELTDSLNVLGAAGSRSMRTAQAAAAVDTAITDRSISMPLAIRPAHSLAKLSILRDDVCNLVHPESGQVIGAQPMGWYLDR